MHVLTMEVPKAGVRDRGFRGVKSFLGHIGLHRNRLDRFAHGGAVLPRSVEPKIRQDDFYLGGIANAFEISRRYAWRYLCAEALAAGRDVPSRREAIKQGANLGMISDLDTWLGLLNTRHIAGHDHVGWSKQEYRTQTELFAE